MSPPLSVRPSSWLLPFSAAVTAIAVMCSVVLAGVVAILPVQLASTAISIQGTGGGNATSLHGILQDWPYTHYGVTQEINDRYPASVFFMGDSVNQGANNLTTILAATPGDKDVICDSQGCVAATIALQRYVANPSTAPSSPQDTTFVMIANPDRPGNGMLAQSPGFYNPLVQLRYPGPTPENSAYKVVDISQEYDGFADEPNNHANLLADANALMGIAFVHPFYGNVDMNDPNNQVKTVGNTTYYLIPTKRLPLLDPLYMVTDPVHLSGVVDALDPPLRTIIDSGYDRSGYQTLGSLQQQPVSAVKPTAVSAVVPHTSVTTPAPKQPKPAKPGDAVKALAARAAHQIGSLVHQATAPTVHHDAPPKPSHVDSGGGHHGK